MSRRWTVLLLCVAAAWPRPVFAGQELILSAASSLTNALQDVAGAFERANPGVRIVLNVAASGSLLQQIEQGAPVDVFASADQDTMDRAQAKGLLAVGTRRNFARSRLVLALPAGREPPPEGLRDLTGSGVERVALGNPEWVPAGRYARSVLVEAGLWEALRPKLVFANNVRQVLDYVRHAEVDAGFVYATDALLAKAAVRTVRIPQPNEPVLYPLAVLAASQNRPLAGRLVAFLLGGEAQSALERFGFEAP